jgi:hypothetical protein
MRPSPVVLGPAASRPQNEVDIQETSAAVTVRFDRSVLRGETPYDSTWT